MLLAMALKSIKPMALTAELVALCERHVPDPGPRSDVTYLGDDGYLALARDYVGQNGPGPLWIFAYGSLIWNPGFHSVEHQRGTAHGWHRRFSMKLTRWRGTPEPGRSLQGRAFVAKTANRYDFTGLRYLFRQ